MKREPHNTRRKEKVSVSLLLVLLLVDEAFHKQAQQTISQQLCHHSFPFFTVTFALFLSIAITLHVLHNVLLFCVGRTKEPSSELFF